MNKHWLDDYSLIVFDKIDSTNLEARRLISTGNVKGKYVITASSQEHGRGRGERSWYSPAGNLYFSLLFDHDNKPNDISQVSLITSLACHEAIQSLLKPKEYSKLKMKWPNDLLFDGKKFCGILLENVPCVDCTQKERGHLRIIHYLIIGVGINLTQSPKELFYTATSLEEEGIEFGSNNDVLHIFMTRFEENYKLWKLKGFSVIRDRWMQNAYNVGEKVVCDLGDSKISGLFKEIDEDGKLAIELNTGEVRKISAGDVFI